VGKSPCQLNENHLQLWKQENAISDYRAFLFANLFSFNQGRGPSCQLGHNSPHYCHSLFNATLALRLSALRVLPCPPQRLICNASATGLRCLIGLSNLSGNLIFVHPCERVNTVGHQNPVLNLSRNDCNATHQNAKALIHPERAGGDHIIVVCDLFVHVIRLC